MNMAPQSEPTAATPILHADGVTKRYSTEADEVTVLRGINLTIHQGEFVTIMGRSGSGKTTLLNCLSLLDEITGGRLSIAGADTSYMTDGQRTSFRSKHMGFIFQAFNLIPVFTAIENVELPLLLAGTPPKKARIAAAKTLEHVGLGHRLHHRPTEMSGGEQQRVAVARALARRPRIVWADEPTGNLDSDTASAVLELLVELNRQGTTIVLVTHDPQIGSAANRVLEMHDGQIARDLRRTP